LGCPVGSTLGQQHPGDPRHLVGQRDRYDLERSPREKLSEPGILIRLVLTRHYAMLQRNLLYTGVTRGKKLVVLVGQKKAVAIAVRNVSGRRRWSKLSEWLRPKRPVS
jgi:hypothetical protein